ncbi:ADP-ribosylation factor-like protein [Vairimorpha necatrix]|uniref:ADP-ribosylation factor-like protein n=1 Tax=Vairimorpha necatrix TaxID=6039 RepID=A0AAX4JD08_9MICR
MGNICSCCSSDMPKFIISVVGLEEDIKNVLKYIVPDFNDTQKLMNFTEYIFSYYNAELIIHAHIITELNKNLISLHSTVESAVIYSVEADRPESIKFVKELVEESNVKNNIDIVTVLCRGKYLDHPELDELKILLNENIHNHFEFVKFNPEESENQARKAIEKIYKILLGRINN